VLSQVTYSAFGLLSGDVRVGIIECKRENSKGASLLRQTLFAHSLFQFLQPIDYHMQFLRPGLGIGLSDLISAVCKVP
jgi:hypothetical protein